MTKDGARATGRSVGDVQSLVTDAAKRYLKGIGVGAVVYSKRLPSIQRAVELGGQVKTDETEGPGDDNNKAKRFAEVAGASEYLIITVGDYKYDTAKKTASFQVTAYRNRTEGGVALATSAKTVSGTAPADVATAFQEGSAIARAAESSVEQVIRGVYPMPPAIPQATVKAKKPRSTQDKERKALTGFGAVLGVLFFSTR
jgi:hypothetical protein